MATVKSALVPGFSPRCLSEASHRQRGGARLLLAFFRVERRREGPRLGQNERPGVGAEFADDVAVGKGGEKREIDR